MMKDSTKVSLGLVWLIVSTGVGITVWAYSTFDTKENAESYQSKGAAEAQNTATISRLDRIESKVDRLLFRQIRRD